MQIEYNIFDTLLEPVFILNSSHSIIYCNETASLLAGVSSRKLKKEYKFLDVFTFSHQIPGLNHLDEIIEPTGYIEVSFKSCADTEGTVQITIQPIFGSNNSEKNWIIFFRDVTLEERLQKKYRAELKQKETFIVDLEKAHQELEYYSRNLEKMVEERTAQISKMNQTLSALLDSLGQGFFIFNKDGLCLDIFSKACFSILEKAPTNLYFWEVLKIDSEKIDGLKKWIKTIFLEMLPFSDLAPLGPQFYNHSENKVISLEYHPLKNESGNTVGVVVVASDITSLIEAKKIADQERSRATMIINLVQNRLSISTFLRESKDLIDELKMELNKTHLQTDATFRILHTLKGTAGVLSAEKLRDECHLSESLLSDYKRNSSTDKFSEFKSTCLRVISEFESLVVEITNILGSRTLSESRFAEVPIYELELVCHVLDSKSSSMEENSISSVLRRNYILQPAGQFIESYLDLSMDLAQNLGKNLQRPTIHSGDIPILPEIYQGLLGSLIHAFRNAIDHAIEMPEERLQKNKPIDGQIEITFLIENKNNQKYLIIKIQDDGKGIDPEKIREKLKNNNIPLDGLTDFQIIQHVFDSGLSTRSEISKISGRGIGMDAILNSAREIGGNAWVESTIDQGTTLFVEVPYIIDSWAFKQQTPSKLLIS